MTTVKYFSDHRKHTYKLADEQQQQKNNPTVYLLIKN